MTNTWDAIVVGGGHNGLAAAAVLARTGRKTLVLEARERVGGLCASEEFWPGYRHAGIHHDTDTVRPWLVDLLDLRTHGLSFAPQAPLLLPDAPGQVPGTGLLLSRELEATQAELAAVGDADGYQRWMSFVGSVRGLVSSVLDAPAPAVGREASLWPLAQPAIKLRRLGSARMLELARVVVLSAEDWLSEFLQDRHLRAGLALGPLLGSWMGPRSPQSAGLLLIRSVLSGDEVAGGAPALVAALERAAKHHGATIQCGTPVEQIRVERGAVRGVVVGGQPLDAPLVVSGLDPRRTLLELVPPQELPVPLEDEVRTVRMRASSAKLHLALSAPPRFTCREGLFERFRAVTDPVQLERAFDDAKHGRLPKSPPLDVRVPTVRDPSLAPAGHHVLSVHIFGVPYQLRGQADWTSADREVLAEAALRELGRLDPGLPGSVVGSELLVPPELEARYGVTGGHLMHGEHALDQLWVGRPGRTTSRHATSIQGLFLGSGGTHPMGGASGAPGALAARRATGDLT
jgi:phytoene dehydrogenase-like protein